MPTPKLLHGLRAKNRLLARRRFLDVVVKLGDGCGHFSFGL